MSSSDETLGAGCGGFVAVAMLACVLWYIGAFDWRKQFEQEAVEHGAAEFVIVDKATGATEFRWHTQPGADHE